MFRRVPSTFVKEVGAYWEQRRQKIHNDSSGNWYIQFTKTSDGPTILSLSVYHQSTSLTEYKKVGSEVISAHKLILCTRVPYFKKMFESGMKEAVENKVEVSDTDPGIFKQFLKFIYTGRVDEDLNDYAADLLELAEIYDIQDLKGFCEASLLNLGKDDNLISTLITAHIYECPELKQKCIGELIQGRKELNKEQLDQMKASLKMFPDLSTEVMMGLMQI